MQIKITLALIYSFATLLAYSQPESNQDTMNVFKRVEKSMKEFTLDTTAAPDDKITRKIIQLRSLKGGFNINEALDFKIEEERQDKETNSVELDKLSLFFKSGNGKKWLDNAVIWIYRRNFNYKELKHLVKFYKTPAGQKMANDFPIIMMQSLAAAEMIKDIYTQQQKR